MLVVFEFKDNLDKILSTSSIEKEMSKDEILVLLNSNEVAYPVNTGILFTIKHCKIENSVYDMFTEPYKLKIILKEM
jgi:hypothetical protein